MWLCSAGVSTLQQETCPGGGFWLFWECYRLICFVELQPLMGNCGEKKGVIRTDWHGAVSGSRTQIKPNHCHNRAPEHKIRPVITNKWTKPVFCSEMWNKSTKMKLSITFFSSRKDCNCSMKINQVPIVPQDTIFALVLTLFPVIWQGMGRSEGEREW